MKKMSLTCCNWKLCAAKLGPCTSPVGQNKRWLHALMRWLLSVQQDYTCQDVYLMPCIDNALDSLQGAKYFSSLDLHSDYWQISMHKHDKKISVSMLNGLYEFSAMPFRLCNASTTFEHMIDTVMHGLKRKTCLWYLDVVLLIIIC